MFVDGCMCVVAVEVFVDACMCVCGWVYVCCADGCTCVCGGGEGVCGSFVRSDGVDNAAVCCTVDVRWRQRHPLHVLQVHSRLYTATQRTVHSRLYTADCTQQTACC